MMLTLDFGDAPDTGLGIGPGNYQTTESDNGPRHVVTGPRLGANVDSESAPNSYREGDVNKIFGYGDNTFGPDEDGVTFTSLLQSSPVGSTSANVVVNVQNSTGNAKLDAWLDFNADGDFVDDGEHIFTDWTVYDGDNNLSFAIPKGAASGKTFARFRLSTAGKLASTGPAQDGEVEDYAVLIGGDSSLRVIQNAILAHRNSNSVSQQFPNGILQSGNDLSFYEQGTLKPWYILDPYFSTIAVRALLVAPDDPAVNKLGVAADHLSFWLSHIQIDAAYPSNKNATIPRLIVDQQFKLLDKTVNGTTDGVRFAPFDPAKIGADADDSSLALILSLATEYWSSGGSTSVLNTHRTKLELVGHTLMGLIQDNGLTNTFLQSSKDNLQRTLDNMEVLQALRQFSTLERDFYQDPVKAALYADKSNALLQAIQREMLVTVSGLPLYLPYAGGKLGPETNLKNNWYPLTLDQVWPIITGMIPATSHEAGQLLTQVYDAWDGGQSLSWTKHTDAGWLTWAAVQAGDSALAIPAVQSILSWALQNSRPFPESAPSGSETHPTAMTIADLGFLLQTLLPAANDDQAMTTIDTPVAIDVRANDYSISTPSSQLAVELTSSPLFGKASVRVDGQIIYSPDPGFKGDDLFLYQVRALDGGTRSARVNVHVGDLLVNQPPNIMGNGELYFVENAASQPINPTLEVRDPDGSTLTSAEVTLTTFLADQDVLGINADPALMGNIAITSNANGVLRLSSSGATATLAQWQVALRSVTYHNLSDNPTTTPRSVSFIVNDGLAASSAFTNAISVNAVNDSPIINSIASVTVNEDSVAGAIQFTIDDVDSPVTSLTLDGMSSNTTLVPNSNIVFGGDGAIRTITMSPAIHQSGTSTITISVSDGTSAAIESFQVTVTAIEHPTTITLSSQLLEYRVSKRLTIAIDETATITDGDTSPAMFARSTLTVSGQSTKDTLSILRKGGITLKGNNVLSDKVVIGSVSGGKKGQPLTIKLNRSATLTSLQFLLRSIAFKSTDRSGGNRRVQIQLTDFGGISHQATRQILVGP